MEKTDNVKTLMRFLKEHGAYYKFVKYFSTPRNTETRNRWVMFHSSATGWEFLQKNDLINFAFIWPETDEGTNYWSNLANEWKKNCHDELMREKERNLVF